MHAFHWAYRPSHPGYLRAWPTILDDTRRIIERTRQTGVVIAGPDGRRRPILDPADGIEFNGDATSDLDGGPFQLLPPFAPVPPGQPIATAFCIAGSKPYGLAVGAVLLRCTQLAPEAFAIAAGRAWSEHWARQALPEPLPAAPLPFFARAVVAELFGTAGSGGRPGGPPTAP